MPELGSPTEGREFDWFLTDQGFQLALFATAGYGAVPRALRAGQDAHANWADTLEDLLALLPVRGSHVEESHGAGHCLEWKEMANRGLFIYDWVHWKGPYRRILRPTNPITVSDMSDDISKTLDAPRVLGLDFQTSESLDDAFVAGIS